MAVEMGKVLTKLNEKLKGRSVSKEHKNALAKRWADKIEAEDDIEKYVDDRFDDIVDASKEADRRVTEATAKAQKDAADAITGKAQAQPEEVEIPSDMPAYAKALLEKIDGLNKRVQGFESARTAETLEQRFLAQESVKGIPANIARRYVPKTEAEFENATTELTTDFGQVQPTPSKSSGFGSRPPGAAHSTTEKSSGPGKVDPAITAFAQQKSKEFQQNQKN